MIVARLELEYERLSPLVVSIQRIDRLIAKASLVRSEDDVAYLEVSPSEVQWVSEWDTAAYNVKSNQHWSIDY